MRIFYLTIFLLASFSAISQDALFYVTLQGDWDKSGNSQEAKFGGNNKFLFNHFGQYSRNILQAGPEINSIAEITFSVNEKGHIDSLSLDKKIGVGKYDFVLLKILEDTNGKWIPKTIDGVRTRDQIKIWIHIYRGPVNVKSKDYFVTKGKEFLATKKYKKAVKYFDNALFYSNMEEEVIRLKCMALKGLDDQTQFCSYLSSVNKFEFDFVDELLIENCK